MRIKKVTLGQSCVKADEQNFWEYSLLVCLGLFLFFLQRGLCTLLELRHEELR